MLESDDDRSFPTTTEARAGAGGHQVRQVRQVLVASLILAILVMTVIAAVSLR